MEHARGKRIAVGLLTSLGTVLALAAAFAIGSFLHYRWLPDFERFARERRAPDTVCALDAGAQLLSADGSFAAGERDALASTGPQRHRSKYSLELLHGELRLLDFEQEFARELAQDPPGLASFATRTARLSVADGFRARVFLSFSSSDRLVGEAARGHGSVRIDAWLLAGAGPSSVTVLAGPPPQRADFVAAPEWTLPGSLAEGANPWHALPESGLVYHSSQSIELMASASNGNTQSDASSALRFEVSTTEYSHELRQRLSEGWGDEPANMTRTCTMRVGKEWNGRVW